MHGSTTGPSLREWMSAADRVTHVQVAVDGAWERAARAGVQASAAELSRLDALLRERGEFAVEAFARDRSARVRFLGVRFDDVDHATACALVHGLWRVACRRGATLARLADWLSRQLGAPLFGGPADFAEVGVVDAWATSGATRVWHATHEPWSDTVLARAREAAAGLRVRDGDIVALELEADRPLPHWVGVALEGV